MEFGIENRELQAKGTQQKNKTLEPIRRFDNPNSNAQLKNLL